MLTKFNLIQICLLVLLFLPLACFSSEVKKERLEFIRSIESRVQRDIPKMDIEKRYKLYVDASRELHRFYFNDYAVKYLNKALLLNVKTSKVSAWVKLLGIHHQQGRTETLKIDLGRFKNWISKNKVKLSIRATNTIAFYEFISSTKTPEEVLTKEQISSINKSFYASEFNWVSFERYLRHKEWKKAKAMIDYSQAGKSSNWSKLKIDLINIKTSGLVTSLHCSSFKKSKDLNPEHLMCAILENHLNKKKADPALLVKFEKSLNALKPEYHWFYGLVKELNS